MKAVGWGGHRRGLTTAAKHFVQTCPPIPVITELGHSVWPKSVAQIKRDSGVALELPSLQCACLAFRGTPTTLSIRDDSCDSWALKSHSWELRPPFLYRLAEVGSSVSVTAWFASLPFSRLSL